jgi:hypothetical protein
VANRTASLTSATDVTPDDGHRRLPDRGVIAGELGVVARITGQQDPAGHRVGPSYELGTVMNKVVSSPERAGSVKLPPAASRPTATTSSSAPAAPTGSRPSSRSCELRAARPTSRNST